MKIFKHFKTILKHKIIVGILCIRCGFIWRGLMHDNSKFSPIEFFSGAKYYQGTGSPINAEKKALGYSRGWQHHKGRNPHHWEYWIDNVGTRANDPIKMPFKYVIEMLCDYIGAGKVYLKGEWTQKSTLEYFNNMLDKRIFNGRTLRMCMYLLDYLSTNGLNKFCKYIRRNKKELKRNYITGAF